MKNVNVTVTDEGYSALRKVKEFKRFQNLSETVDFVAVYALEKIEREA